MTDIFTYTPPVYGDQNDATDSDGIGAITYAAFNPETQSDLVHAWVTQPYASYWGMQDQTVAEVRATYQAMLARSGVEVFIGSVAGTPAFLVERYTVETDPIAGCYEVEPGDIGMHLLIAPTQSPRRGFSTAIIDRKSVV